MDALILGLAVVLTAACSVEVTEPASDDAGAGGGAGDQAGGSGGAAAGPNSGGTSGGAGGDRGSGAGGDEPGPNEPDMQPDAGPVEQDDREYYDFDNGCLPLHFAFQWVCIEFGQGQALQEFEDGFQSIEVESLTHGDIGGGPGDEAVMEVVGIPEMGNYTEHGVLICDAYGPPVRCHAEIIPYASASVVGIRDGAAVVEVIYHRGDDATCCPSGRAELRIRLDDDGNLDIDGPAELVTCNPAETDLRGAPGPDWEAARFLCGG
jgi:hypothetical protein